ncbi:hypothetical protein G6F46_002848 [Rhizopus delemar]|nr:hypothetical protein G6F46_002848 [Rhizopus delemar]
MKQDFTNITSPLNVILLSLIILSYFCYSPTRRSILLQLLIIPCSIIYHWTHSIKVLFSLSLSPKEQSKFEEQFKYLIVTSSLFNELNQQQQQQQQLQQQQQPTYLETSTPITSGAINSVVLVANVFYILLLAAVYKYYYHEIFIYGLTLSYAVSSYFLYRHNPLTDPQNLSRLQNMYMTVKVQQTDFLILSIRAKRREYLLHLLALDVMSNNHAAHYGRNWKRAIQVNNQLVLEYNALNKQLYEVTTTESLTVITEPKSMKEVLSPHPISVPSTPASDSLMDETCVSLMQKIATVERQMDESQSKLFACRQDVKYLSSGRVSTQSLNRISKRFTNINDTLTKLMNQWTESKSMLDSLLAERQHKDDGSLPSPPSSPVRQEVQRSFSLNHGDIHMRRRNRNSYFL